MTRREKEERRYVLIGKQILPAGIYHRFTTDENNVSAAFKMETGS